MIDPNEDNQAQPPQKQSFFQWYFSLFTKKRPSLLSKDYVPSSHLFAAVRIWTIILIVLIVVLFIAVGVVIGSQMATPHASSAAWTGAVLAGMVIGAFIPFIAAGLFAIIPFIMSIIAAAKLNWKIQPLERAEMYFTGALTLMGVLWGYPNIPGLLSLIGQ